MNVTNRLAALRDPLAIVEVFSAADLPDAILAPDGIMRRPLAQETEYRVHATFSWPRLLLPELTNFLGAQVLSLVGANQSVVMFLDGGGTSIPHIWGRNTGFFLVRDLTVVDLANAGVGRGTVALDIVGGGPLSTFSVDFSAFINFKALGKTVDAAVNWTSVGILGNEAGLAAIQSGDVDFVQVLTTVLILQPQVNPIPALKPAFYYKCLGAGTTDITGAPINQTAGDSFICLDSAATGGFQITGMSYAGVSLAGEFFRSDVSLALTAMASVDKAIASFAADAKAVVSVAAGTTGTNFSTGTVRHQWAVGDTVTGSGFPVGAYNVVQTITALPDPFTYQVGALAFVSDATGTATDDLATVCGSVQAGFTVGQVILISGAPAAFNGLRQIKSVAVDENSFVIAVDFATGSAGTGTIEITRVTTATGHPMFVGETQTISGTTSYNGTTAILFTPTDDTFDIPVAFVANDAAGLVVSTCRDQKSLGVFVRSCGAQAESRSLGVGDMNSNAVLTTVAAPSVYQALDCSGMTQNAVTERFTQTSATNGVYTFNGLQPIVVRVQALITALKGGATQMYRFATSVNGAIPTFATAPFGPMEVRATAVNATMSQFVELEQGDTVQVMIAGDGHSDNITITDLQLQIEAVG